MRSHVRKFKVTALTAVVAGASILLNTLEDKAFLVFFAPLWFGIAFGLGTKVIRQTPAWASSVFNKVAFVNAELEAVFATTRSCVVGVDAHGRVTHQVESAYVGPGESLSEKLRHLVPGADVSAFEDLVLSMCTLDVTSQGNLLASSLKIAKSLRRIVVGVDEPIIDTVQALFAELLANFSHVWQDEIYSAADVNTIRILANSPLAQLILKIVALATLYPLTETVGQSLTEKIREDVFQLLKSKLKGEDSISVVELFLTSFQLLIEKGPDFLRTGDPRYLNPDDISLFIESVNFLKDHFHNRVLLNPKEGQIMDVLYRQKLSDSMGEAKRLIEFFGSKNNAALRNEILRMRSELSVLHTRLQVMDASAVIRPVPFCIFLYGNVGTGKSTIVPLLTALWNKVSGLPNDGTTVFYRNSSSEYWDGIYDYCPVIVMDDIGSKHPDMVQEDPGVAEFIHVVNNLPYPLNMSAVEDKGRMFCNPQFVLATGNVKNLHAHRYASTPQAVLRRIDLTITVHVKPEFQDSDLNGKPVDTICLRKVSAWKAANPGLEPNLNRFCVEKYVTGERSGAGADTYRTLLDTDDAKVFYNFIRECYEQHISKVTEDSARVALICDECCLPLAVCEHSSKQIVSASHRGLSSLKHLFGCLENCIWDSWSYGSPNYVCRNLMWLVMAWRLGNVAYYPYFRRVYLGLEVFGLSPSIPASIVLARTATKYGPHLLMVSSVCCFLCMYFKLRNDNKVVLVSSGVSASTPIPDMGPKPSKSPWIYRVPLPILPQGHAGKGAAQDLKSFQSLIASNVINIAVGEPGSKDVVRVHATCLCGTTYVTVAHALPLCERFTIYVEEEHRVVSQDYVKSDVYFVDDGRDFILFQIHKLRPKKSIVKYLLPSLIEQMADAALWNGREWVHGVSRHVVVPVQNRYAGVVLRDQKLRYIQGDFRTGDCGYPMITFIGGQVQVIGFLTAVKEGAVGYATSVFTSDVERYLNHVEDHNLIVSSSEPGEVDLGGYKLGEIHEKSTMRWMEGSGSSQDHGTLQGAPRSKGRSKVVKTLISECVEKHFGVTAEFGAPDLVKGWKLDAHGKRVEYYNPYNATLSERCKEGGSIPDSELAVAYVDYVSRLEEKSFRAQPLTVLEALHGVPGERFVDAMNFSSSGGWPRQGSKRKLLVTTYANGVEIPLEKQVFTPDVMEEIDRIWDRLGQGIKCEPVFTTQMKDEPTTSEKIKKGKVRLFQVAPLAFSVVQRRLFLRLAAFLQTHNLHSEMAVGCNALSRDWSDFAKYILMGNEHRKIINGDFSKYDVNLHLNLLKYAGKVLVKLAADCGYSVEDIRRCKTCIDDVVYHFENVDGDLVTFDKGHCSGHSLTVILNSIANSLLMRCAYVRCGNDISTFRSNVHLLTYGDDNIAGVNDSVILTYNHLTIAEVFASYGLTYTMADKDSDMRPFVTLPEADFLKRKFIYYEYTDQYLAPLNTSSLLKSLTWRVDNGTITQQEHAVEILNNYVREATQYGPGNCFEAHVNAVTIAEAVGLSWRDLISVREAYEAIDSEDLALFDSYSEGVRVFEEWLEQGLVTSEEIPEDGRVYYEAMKAWSQYKVMPMTFK